MTGKEQLETRGKESCCCMVVISADLISVPSLKCQVHPGSRTFFFFKKSTPQAGNCSKLLQFSFKILSL